MSSRAIKGPVGKRLTTICPEHPLDPFSPRTIVGEATVQATSSTCFQMRNTLIFISCTDSVTEMHELPYESINGSGILDRAIETDTSTVCAMATALFLEGLL
ncbi:hypothetical protein X777_12710 [Ooceraea biroi]|uniref:Uncharacterized protein n=1 Tax=Ooceraea biroi TaxID=2015173 RepID=A0A026W154_OOCBI|nr:hypothetical protein X777_12710 [Ooceraea biroi]